MLKKISIFAILVSLQACSLKYPSYIRNDAKVSELSNLGKLKMGEACAYAPLFYYPPIVGYHDNINLIKAAKDAGIERILYSESEMTSYVIYSKYCAKVYGE